MKKQYFIYSVITCMLVIFNVKAQNTPIDDFLKRYPSREGVTDVSISPQIMQSMFRMYSATPETYRSVSVSKTDVAANLFTDFEKTLISSKYEQYLEVNKEDGNLRYYMKKLTENSNEIVVMSHQKGHFSAIYIKGNIAIGAVDSYLRIIKDYLIQIGATNTIPIERQFAFTLPSFDDLKFPIFKEFEFKFDPDAFNFKIDEDLKLRMEESMKKMKDAFDDEDFQRKIKDSMEDVQRRIEEAQRQ